MTFHKNATTPFLYYCLLSHGVRTFPPSTNCTSDQRPRIRCAYVYFHIWPGHCQSLDIKAQRVLFTQHKVMELAPVTQHHVIPVTLAPHYEGAADQSNRLDVWKRVCAPSRWILNMIHKSNELQFICSPPCYASQH